MIISKTPYRISFFGGGSDYPSWYIKNGGSVLSTTIDKYVYFTCKDLPPFFDHKHRIVWSNIELVKKLSEIKLKPARELLKYFRIKNGLEIHYEGDLPAMSGMGSSSVFVVGLMNLLNNYCGKKISKKQLAKKSIFFEQKILKEDCGSQDQIAATYGGFNKINFTVDGDFNIRPFKTNKGVIKLLNRNLILLYSGFKRTSYQIASTYINKLQSSKKSNIIRILNLAKEGEKALTDNKLYDFAALLHESWLQKRELDKSISTSKIDEIYATAMKKGALGGKLLGAGGGGFFLFYVNLSKQKYFIKHLSKLISVPFKFSFEGSKIMFKNLKDSTL